MSNRVVQQPQVTDLLPPEDLSSALGHLARVDGVGGWKGLACYINPKKSDDPQKAGQWLDRALDPGRRENFKKEHLDRAIELGIKVGCHIVWDWYCRDRGYKTSDPLNSKSREMMLLEEDARMAFRRTEIRRELDEIQSARADVPRAVR